MNKDNTNNKASRGLIFKGTKKEMVALMVIAIFILFVFQFVILTIVIPLVKGSGIDDYRGAKKIAATRALEAVSLSIDGRKRWASSLHVDAVYTTTPIEISKFCSGQGKDTTSDPENIQSYTVVMSVKELFTYSGPTLETRVGCSGSPINGF